VVCRPLEPAVVTHVRARHLAAGAQGADQLPDESAVALAQRLVLVAGGQVLGDAPAAARGGVGLDVEPHLAVLHIVGAKVVDELVNLCMVS